MQKRRGEAVSRPGPPPAGRRASRGASGRRPPCAAARHGWPGRTDPWPAPTPAPIAAPASGSPTNAPPTAPTAAPMPAPLSPRSPVVSPQAASASKPITIDSFITTGLMLVSVFDLHQCRYLVTAGYVEFVRGFFGDVRSSPHLITDVIVSASDKRTADCQKGHGISGRSASTRISAPT